VGTIVRTVYSLLGERVQTRGMAHVREGDVVSDVARSDAHCVYGSTSLSADRTVKSVYYTVALHS
jgi:hypothetical protein